MELEIPFPGNLRVHAACNGCVVETNQTIRSGGDGSAPAPFDLFLASLGTCAGFFMLAFMKQRGIEPAGSGITVTPEADPETGMVRRISFAMGLPADFPEKYERAVVRAVDRCPVKRHIEDPPEFVVTTSRPRPA